MCGKSRWDRGLSYERVLIFGVLVSGYGEIGGGELGMAESTCRGRWGFRIRGFGVIENPGGGGGLDEFQEGMKGYIRGELA